MVICVSPLFPFNFIRVLEAACGAKLAEVVPFDKQWALFCASLIVSLTELGQPRYCLLGRLSNGPISNQGCHYYERSHTQVFVSYDS